MTVRHERADSDTAISMGIYTGTVYALNFHSSDPEINDCGDIICDPRDTLLSTIITDHAHITTFPENNEMAIDSDTFDGLAAILENISLPNR